MAEGNPGSFVIHVLCWSALAFSDPGVQMCTEGRTVCNSSCASLQFL